MSRPLTSVPIQWLREGGSLPSSTLPALYECTNGSQSANTARKMTSAIQPVAIQNVTAAALLRLDVGLVERVGDDAQRHDLAGSQIDLGPEERRALRRRVESVAVAMRELLHGGSSDR